ncbi:MAG TPA: ABC transporter ATP-binding protein, partial [Polyangiaceae bacterium]|nr:ABC transporter ATP-binding protein [Polyangiaceae bacterium]
PPPTADREMFRLELLDVTKRYPGVVANDGVSLGVLPGEIHAVLGENGAGKSTLMKIIYGMLRPDSGELRWNGDRLEAHGPRAARAHGIAMVFQHFSLFESMTVAQNVWLGLDPHAADGRRRSLDAVRADLRRVADDYRLPLDPERSVHDLSVGERQRVEILRALLARPRLLILDEPTSVLTPQAVQALFATLRQLAAEGCSILYISHKLDEIQALCHTATVLRAGRVVGTADPRRETTASLARLMLGDEPPRVARAPNEPRGASLVVERLGVERSHEFGVTLRDVSFEVRGGEILGIAGVSGNGQRELLGALSGEDAERATGAIRLWDEDVTRSGPQLRRRRGLRFVPEERLGRASVPSLSLLKNALLTRPELVSGAGFVQNRALRALTQRLLARYDVKAGGPEALAGSLSGGNLQKFIVARELDATPRVFIVSQPTWGVDVGASAQIRAQLVALRDAGSAVLIVSEDLDELFEICDALVVIAGGRLSPRLATEDMSADRIGEWMSGLWPGAAEARASEGARRASA